MMLSNGVVELHVNPSLWSRKQGGTCNAGFSLVVCFRPNPCGVHMAAVMARGPFADGAVCVVLPAGGGTALRHSYFPRTQTCNLQSPPQPKAHVARSQRAYRQSKRPLVLARPTLFRALLQGRAPRICACNFHFRLLAATRGLRAPTSPERVTAL